MIPQYSSDGWIPVAISLASIVGDTTTVRQVDNPVYTITLHASRDHRFSPTKFQLLN